jgi:hypothetical protein
MNDTPPLEEVVGAQALGVDLKLAVMACLSGGESRRRTVGELVERFKGLGICASRARVTAALADIDLELEFSAWAPWHLVERRLHLSATDPPLSGESFMSLRLHFDNALSTSVFLLLPIFSLDSLKHCEV